MKTNTTRDKILELLFKFPLKKFHIRELSRVLKISPPAISNALKQLEKEGFVLHISEEKTSYKIQANFSNKNFRNMKRIDNLKNIYSSGLLDYLIENFPLSAIILFGSYSKGDDTEKSDIDMAIESKEKNLNLESYEKKLNKKINIEFISFSKLSNELRNSIINGIVLSGYVELK